ncbi:hypothetical protein LOCC1_G005212 [Lachnellula occidentalis]|uniref:Cyclin N-terminal domain-containing protein n=1 Tax=Lachnellula occidentalis TaxID=215460 RepID=A0A8H8RQQ5_9HELO|nr:hypothetical protein LOCC1_G005212 [Lachnellula occidentalis]
MDSRRRRSSASSFDDAFIESYLSKTYIPLSNLPTPPPTSHSNSSTHKQPSFLTSGEIHNPKFLGPAIHLTNLVPSSTSLKSPSVPLVHALLTRANLPLETLALAVCILDSLNSRFALTWRQGCPLVPLARQHIDSIQPEIIVLSAVILAVKFLDDMRNFTGEFAREWGRNLWSCVQINFTQRCILENLGYRLMPLCEQSIISEALEDMNRAAMQASPESSSNKDWAADMCSKSFGGDIGRKMSDGQAVLGLGEQMTPAETPMLENVPRTKDLSVETKLAFKSGRNGMDAQQFQLPERLSVQEPFPTFVDPMLERMGNGLG